MAIKSLSGNVPLSKAVSVLIFPSKMSGLATQDYEDDDFDEVSKGRFLVGTEDVIDVDEVSKGRFLVGTEDIIDVDELSKCSEGIP